MAYAPVTVTGYNANPPPDDGTAVALNQVAWSKHIDKIGAPLKNAIDGIQTAISAAVDPLDTALKAPVGTRMVFHQTAAPTGWTKDVSRNDKALRVVSGTVGADGGTTAFSTLFAARTIAQANLPNVNILSALTVSGTPAFGGAAAGSTFITNGVVETNFAAGGVVNARKNTDAQLLSVNAGTLAVSATAHLNGNITQTTMDFSVQRVDVIIAQKD